MSRHICFYCKYQYVMVYRPCLKCMNEKSEKYGEDVDANETCDHWEDLKGTDNE